MFNNKRVKNALLIIFTPSVLCVVAFLQIYHASAFNLSPWKGGGFGMFSRVDAPSARYLKVYLITEDDENAIRTPKSMRDLAREFATFPTKSLGYQFTNEIIAILGDALDFNFVRVEVWRYRFDRASLQLRGVKLQEFVQENPENQE